MTITLKTNAGNLAARMRRRALNFQPMQKGAMRVAVGAMKDEALKLSGTRYASLAELRRRGHPYARRRWKGNKHFSGVPALPAPSYIINRQSGQFHESWRTYVRTWRAHISGTLYNIAPWSKYLTEKGTSKMIGRPIMIMVIRRAHRRMAAALLNAKRQNERRA